MCHGLNSQRQEYLDMFPKAADILASRGYASVRFDFRGHGESSGSSTDFSIIGQIIDLRSVVQWVWDKFGTTSKLGFLGVSFGAAPGIFLEIEESIFDKLALFAPVLSYVETFLFPTEEGRGMLDRHASEGAENDGYIIYDQVFHMSVRLIEEMRLLRPDVEIARVASKTLLVHGTADSLVPCSVALGLRDSLKELRVDIVEGMEHGLYLAGDPKGKSSGSQSLETRILHEIVDYIAA